MRGVWVFSVVFTLAFTSSGSLPFIGCFILFSQFSLVCFIICNDEKRLVHSSSIDEQFRGLPGLGFGVGLVAGSCHSLFFSLGLPFCFSSYIVHLSRCLTNRSFFLCVG